MCRPFPPKSPDLMGDSTGLRDVAIVGVGATPYYKRGESIPRTITELAGEAILAACADAGLSVREIDGFAYYSGATAGYTDKMDTADFMETLGIPEVTFTAARARPIAPAEPPPPDVRAAVNVTSHPVAAAR